MENEILAAEIYLHPVHVETATADIDAELAQVEQAIKSYTVNASLLEYSIAVGSGLLAGAVDAFYVKEDPLFQNLSSMDRDKLVDLIKRVIQRKPSSGQAIPVYKFHQAVETGFPELIPEIEKAARHATPLGLAAAILVQIERGGMLTEKDKKLQIFPDGIAGGDAVILIVASIFVGVMKWLLSISVESDENESGKVNVLDRLCKLIRETKTFQPIVKEIEKWQRQLPNEIRARNGKKNESAGVEETFYSFFVMLAGIPALRESNLRKTIQSIEDGKRLLSGEKPILMSLNRQGFPVLLNEVLVRSLFFACRLIRELTEKEEIDQIDWGLVVPFGNRDIDRLIALSSMTLTTADTADAAIHAAIDSCGEAVLFARSFVSRFNYVAAGRAAVAVFREISNEQMQAELIHRKRLLMEARTARAIEILEAYQQQLEKRVSEYLAADITAFLEGFECMDRGLLENNSDLVIQGNVKIQRVLGREPQFTNQHEFDDLMDSDIPLTL